MNKWFGAILFLAIIAIESNAVVAQNIEKKAKGSENPDIELHRKTTKDKSIIAIWMGTDPNIDLEMSGMPLTYSVRKCFFEFRNTKERIEFQSKDNLFFSDWSFDIFSPDFRFAVLLQGHFGPYHIISVKNLRDYLLGHRVTFETVSGQTPRGAAAVHGSVTWITSDKLEFSAECCGRRLYGYPSNWRENQIWGMEIE